MFGSNNKSGFGSSSFGNSGFGNTNSGGGGLFGNTNTNSQSNSLFGNTSNSGTTGNFNCQNLDISELPIHKFSAESKSFDSSRTEKNYQIFYSFEN